MENGSIIVFQESRDGLDTVVGVEEGWFKNPLERRVSAFYGLVVVIHRRVCCVQDPPTSGRQVECADSAGTGTRPARPESITPADFA